MDKGSKKLIYLPADLAARLSKEANQSATCAEALKFFYEFKDTGKAMIANSHKVLELIKQKDTPTGSFQDEELVQARESHPGWRIERKDGELMAWHRGRHFWQPLSDAEMDAL